MTPDDNDTIVVDVETAPNPPVERVDVEIAPAKKDQHRDGDTGQFARNSESDSELAQLRTQLADAEKERARVRAEAARLRNENGELASRVNQTAHYAAETEYASVNDRLVNAVKEQKALRDKLTMFNSLGDYESAADVQVELTRIAVQESDDRRLKRTMEAEYHANKQRQQQNQRRDPFEEALRSRSQPTQDWLRAHPECITDAKTGARAQAAHYDAEEAGLKADTADYFRFIEERLGYRKSRDSDDDRKPVTQASREEARTLSPPVHRDGASRASYGATRVSLTAEEVQAAHDMGMSKEDYARNKVAVQKSGRFVRYEASR